MLKVVRRWTEDDNKTYTHLRYSVRDFYGPTVDLLMEKKEELLPIVEVIPQSYKFEDVTVADGINKTIVNAAKEIFKEYGEHKIKTKFGCILISSSDTEKIFSDFKERIILF